MGATALLYTALDRLLLHPLPVADGDRLVRVGEFHPPVTSWIWFPYRFYQSMQRMSSLPYDAVAWAGALSVVALTGAGASLQPLRTALAAEPATVLRED